MSVVLCQQNKDLRRLIEDYAEVLKREAHRLGHHGLDQQEFYNSGVFRGAIERVRGQFSASMDEKRQFASTVFEHLRSKGLIESWHSAGEANRHDYIVRLGAGRICAIELKGCLDGNNTNIFERPASADEFVVWSVCTNAGSNPRRNVWSGIHTRLSAEIVERQQRVDGLIVWDMLCATAARPCPKLLADPNRSTKVESYSVPPPCVYVFPATIASVRTNPRPSAQRLDQVHFLAALHRCFHGSENEVHYVDFELAHQDAETVRKTIVRRGGTVAIESSFDAIKRS